MGPRDENGFQQHRNRKHKTPIKGENGQLCIMNPLEKVILHHGPSDYAEQTSPMAKQHAQASLAESENFMQLHAIDSDLRRFAPNPNTQEYCRAKLG